MKYGSSEYYRERYRDVVKEEAKLKYRDKVKVFLSFSLKELKAAKHPLYDVIMKKFPTMDEDATLDEVRIFKLFEKVFNEGSMKALEMTYRLDGSMNDLVNEPDYEELDEALEDIK